MPDFSKRSYEPEIMDDLDMQGEELAATLRQLAMVNRWLGGLNVVLQGVKRLLATQKTFPKALKIIDIGCGGGEVLRLIADWARKKNIKTELIGIDANAFTIAHAANLSKDYPEITFLQMNVFEADFAAMDYDIALCCLFLHHFTETEIVQILKTITNSARIGIVINDLQRSALAHFLFDLVTRVLGASKMVRYDGKLSIRRAFNKKELHELMKDADIKKYKIAWRWAFRYELRVMKNEE